jgi:hypothetical protein
MNKISWSQESIDSAESAVRQLVTPGECWDTGDSSFRDIGLAVLSVVAELREVKALASFTGGNYEQQ